MLLQNYPSIDNVLQFSLEMLCPLQMAVLLLLFKINVIFALQMSFFAFIAAPLPFPFQSRNFTHAIPSGETTCVTDWWKLKFRVSYLLRPIQNCLLPSLGRSKERQVNPVPLEKRRV